ncbi:hypothetical protein EJB05_45813, partial [Eragrostis curvula]
MAIDVGATAGIALAVSIIALHLLSFLDHSGTATTPQALPAAHNSALQVFLSLAGMEGLVAAVAFIYGEMHRARAAGAGAVNRRISERVTTILCASVSLLFSVLFVQPAGGADDDGAAARALGAVALRALPAAATATFFLGVMMIYAHVANRVGAGAGAGAGPVPEPAVNLLAKITLGAAVAVVTLMAMALNTN